MSKPWDVVVLTQKEYVEPVNPSSYVVNILREDQLVLDGLQAAGLKAMRTHWDDPTMDWSTTQYVMFRTIWDYFHRFDEFSKWMDQASQQCQAINSWSLVRWNMHKFYLRELNENGVSIPETLFLPANSRNTLQDLFQETSWTEAVLKPAVSGAGRETYRIPATQVTQYEAKFQSLIAREDMLLQKFEPSIMDRGEAALMFVNGQYTHAVLKKAKPGDFRVQDDFGGSVHPYKPTIEEITYAENVMRQCPEVPIFGRVDIFWTDAGEMILGELEIIEPEMWIRKNEKAATLLGRAVKQRIDLSL